MVPVAGEAQKVPTPKDLRLDGGCGILGLRADCALVWGPKDQWECQWMSLEGLGLVKLQGQYILSFQPSHLPSYFTSTRNSASSTGTCVLVLLLAPVVLIAILVLAVLPVAPVLVVPLHLIGVGENIPCEGDQECVQPYLLHISYEQLRLFTLMKRRCGV